MKFIKKIMNIEEVFLGALANLIITSVIYLMFGLHESNTKLKYGFFICWLLFSVILEYQTSDSFPLLSLIFGFGYLLAYYAVKNKS